ncbi:hypothetical protein C8J56DRAFT_161442 [Mycena floridula]|nr:hypothetical protein C8J56DRAFT_161442 [Mycena floridula]
MKLEHASASVNDKAVDLYSATEIPFPIASEWPDDRIIEFMLDSVVGIPPKTPPGPHFFPVTSHSLGVIPIPCKYRIPLLWVSKYQWKSLQLVLNASDRETEWEEYKLRILHVARLCNGLLERAKNTMTGRRIDKRWRCPMFDRVLVRYWDHFLNHDAESIQEHTSQFGSVYKADILKLGWKEWARKGCQGFNLTEEEVENGITADEFTAGLEKKDGVWTWNTMPGSLPPPTPSDFQVQNKRAQVKPEPVSTTILAKPSVSVAKPAASVSKPAASVSKPAASVSKPAATLAKPSASVAKLPVTLSKTPGTNLKAKAPGTALPAPRGRPPKASALPLPVANQLETMERQMSGLMDQLKKLQHEQTRARAGQEALRDEYVQSQQEIRTLKRKFSGLGNEDAGRDGLVYAPPPASATASTLGHALSHLLTDHGDLVKSEERDETAETHIMSVSARPWKSQRKVQQFNV